MAIAARTNGTSRQGLASSSFGGDALVDHQYVCILVHAHVTSGTWEGQHGGPPLVQTVKGWPRRLLSATHLKGGRGGAGSRACQAMRQVAATSPPTVPPMPSSPWAAARALAAGGRPGHDERAASWHEQMTLPWPAAEPPPSPLLRPPPASGQLRAQAPRPVGVLPDPGINPAAIARPLRHRRAWSILARARRRTSCPPRCVTPARRCRCGAGPYRKQGVPLRWPVTSPPSAAAAALAHACMPAKRRRPCTTRRRTCALERTHAPALLAKARSA